MNQDKAGKNFFEGEAPSLSLSDLENELAEARDPFLAGFSQHRIPWQKWDKGLLEKARKAQRPICVLVGSAVTPAALQVADEIDQSEDLRTELTSKVVCTVIDGQAYPEMELLSYLLATESKASTQYPMLIWLSHEGAPLASIPVGLKTGRELSDVVLNSTAMVNEIWSDSSKYAVEHSQADNEQRQKRMSYLWRDGENDISRSELFRQETRQLASFYNARARDLDFVGGIIPYSSLELLQIGSQSRLLLDHVRDRCREAALGVSDLIISAPSKDPLDGSYFSMRRSKDWSLPTFTKTLSSQCHIATFLIRCGQALDKPRLLNEGLALLEVIEQRWMAKGVVSLAPRGEQDQAGSFLWDFESLQKALNEEQFALAKTAFSLSPDGNIPLGVDPTGRFVGLNHLTEPESMAGLAAGLSLTEEEAKARLQVIRDLLLAYRHENTAFLTGTTLQITDLTHLLRAQIARAVQSGQSNDLEAAQATAERILTEFKGRDGSLLRINSNGRKIAARGNDYFATALALTQLYQVTLDPRWLESADQLSAFALKNLRNDDGLVFENPEEEKIVSLDVFNVAMVFGESTFGLADQVAVRLGALTGDKVLQDLANTHLEVIRGLPRFAVINHTDFIASCALGDVPLVAVVHGPRETPAVREAIQLLNAPQRLAFLTVRSDQASDRLAPLPALDRSPAAGSVTLIRGDDVLGHAPSPADLIALLDSALAKR